MINYCPITIIKRMKKKINLINFSNNISIIKNKQNYFIKTPKKKKLLNNYFQK